MSPKVAAHDPVNCVNAYDVCDGYHLLIPAYEAAREALERIVAMADGFAAVVEPTSEWAQTIEPARAALARLRDEVLDRV